MKKLSVILALTLLGCSNHEVAPPTHGEVGVAVAPHSIAGNDATNAGPTLPVSGGANALGVIIPTSGGVVARIENGLEGSAKSTTGNFAKALTQVRTNLPKV